eukprot:477238_1
MLPVQIEPHSIVYYHYLCGIGSIVMLIIVTTILIHISFHFLKLFRSATEGTNKTLFILYIILSLITVYLCIMYGFIKCNLLNQFKPDNYSQILCSISHHSVFIGFYIYAILFYVLLLYRIQIVFNNTSFQYPLKYFKILYSTIFISYICVACSLIYTAPLTRFGLFIPKNTHQIYCGTLNDNPDRSFAAFLAAIIYVVLQVIFNIITVYMFTNRFNTLKLKLVQTYLQQIEMQKNEIPTDQNHDGDRHLSVAEIESQSKNGDDNAQRILELHQLIKKHSILAFISMMLGITWLFSTIFVSGWMSIQVVWFFGGNNICLWLMFKCCEPYWKFAKKYLCCYVCYRNNHRSIASSSICCC